MIKMKDNPMRKIRINKVTLNVGTGKDQAKLEKGLKLLKHISGIDPVKTVTQKRIASWGLRPGLPIGCKITLRKEEAEKLLKRVLTAVDNKLSENNFDDNGNISFGIKEYIDIKDTKYEPDIGSMGLQCSITLDRPGFRIKNRRILSKQITHRHKISRIDAIAFMKENFNIKMSSEDEE